MPPREQKGFAGTPQEWLNRAKSNLEMAKAAIRLKAVYLEDACFEAQQAAPLTRFAIATRYPGLTEPVTKKEYEKAVTTAKAVVQWAENLLGKKS